MRLIVTSQKDIAGTNIYHHLARNMGFEEAGEFEGRPLYKKGDVWLINSERNQTLCEHLDDHFDTDYYVFASRHRSESQERTLTVHVTGNLTGEAKVGGNPYEIAWAEPGAMKVALLELERQRVAEELPYHVSLEATHHGPTMLKRPLLFVEVGSTEEEWGDERAVAAVAKAALMAAESTGRFPVGLGIGGNHYCPIHTRTVLGTDVAMGHVIPSYVILDTTEDVFRQAIEKTGAEFGFLDWKGMNKKQRDRVKELAEKTGLELKRGRDVRTGDGPSGEEYALNGSLFFMAMKTDRPGMERRLQALGAALVTDEKGRPQNAVIAESDIREEVHIALIDLIGENKRFAIQGDTLFVLERRFDPEKAKMLGIRPGPLFGRLSSGQEVDIEGRTITADMVMVTEKTVVDLGAGPIREKIFKYIIGKWLQKED